MKNPPAVGKGGRGRSYLRKAAVDPGLEHMKITLEIELEEKIVAFYRNEMPAGGDFGQYLSFLCAALLRSLYDSERQGGPEPRPDSLPSEE